MCPASRSTIGHNSISLGTHTKRSNWPMRYALFDRKTQIIIFTTCIMALFCTIMKRGTHYWTGQKVIGARRYYHMINFDIEMLSSLRLGVTGIA